MLIDGLLIANLIGILWIAWRIERKPKPVMVVQGAVNQAALKPPEKTPEQIDDEKRKLINSGKFDDRTLLMLEGKDVGQNELS